MHQRPRTYRPALLARALVVGVAVVGVVVGSAAASSFILPLSPAAAVDNGSLGIRPSNESDFFHLTVLPGESLRASAIVSNHTSAPVELSSYVVDGLTSADGKFSLKADARHSETIGLWATADFATVTVPAETELSIPFTLSVPVGTPAGDYTGGLMVQSKPVPGTTSTANGSPVRIDVVQRQGVRIYLSVPGVVKLGLTAGELRWAASGEVIVVSLAVTNTGNSTLHPTATAQVERLWGEPTVVDFRAPEGVPPGAQVTMTARIPAAPFVQLATVTAQVESAAGELSRESTIVVVPLIISISVASGVMLVALIGWRIARFVRRARRAFAAIERTARGHPGSVVEQHR